MQDVLSFPRGKKPRQFLSCAKRGVSKQAFGAQVLKHASALHVPTWACRRCKTAKLAAVPNNLAMSQGYTTCACLRLRGPGAYDLEGSVVHPLHRRVQLCCHVPGPPHGWW